MGMKYYEDGIRCLGDWYTTLLYEMIYYEMIYYSMLVLNLEVIFICKNF